MTQQQEQNDRLAPASAEFTVNPTSLDRESFVRLFGAIYEHSPWVAEGAYDSGLSPQANYVDGLVKVMSAIVADADRSTQLALINAHPDLAGKAAVAGELTEESTSEQASAGLDQCTEAEFQRFQQLNSDYRDKFGFPFVMAVKGRHRTDILDAFERRLQNDHDTEFGEALAQINEIARLRLLAMTETHSG